MAIVYTHTRNDNGRMFYIGIGKELGRAYNKINRTNYWKRVVAKTDYTVDIVLSGITWEQACFAEQELIKVMGRVDLGTGHLVNMTDGGEGVINRKLSLETKNKISKKLKGNLNTLGVSSWIKGLHWGENIKSKISNSLKGYKHSEASLNKRRNRVISEETRKRMSDSAKARCKSDKGILQIKNALKSRWEKDAKN